MIFLLCPKCENAMLEITKHGRECPECLHAMTEVEYQLHHAHCAELTEKAFAGADRDARKSFGKKKTSDTPS